MDFKRLKQKIAAEAVGISTRSLISWKNAPRNPDGTYSLPDLVKWMLKQAAGPSESEIDKISKQHLSDWRKEKAALARMEREAIEGRYYDAEQTDRETLAYSIQIRESIESIPARTAALLAAEPGAWECQKILEMKFILP
jgi:hypothetical protein